MVKYVKGNFFDYNADIRVNTVNCVGVMGAGVALQFKKKYPRMYEEYVNECLNGRVKIGLPHVWQENDIFSNGNLTIINFPTKDHWKKPSEYEYLEKGLIWLKNYLSTKKDSTITLPALGCGHGGLDWEIVKGMINLHLDDLSTTILVFEPESSVKIDEEKVSETFLQENDILRFLPNEKKYPNKLKGRSATIIFIKGDEHIFQHKILSIVVNSKADDREKNALLRCIDVLPLDSITYALGFNSSFEIDIARTFLEKGAKVILFLPYGILKLKVRKDLIPYWNEQFVTLVTSASPNQEWKINHSIDVLKMRIKLSDAILISNHELNSIQKFEKDFTESHNPVFYINYWNHTNEFYNRISAKKIGRDKITNQPNVVPIIEELV